MLEARVESRLKRGVESLGGVIRKFVTPGRKHAPDRLVIWPGNHVHFIELKRPRKKPRPGQVREHERLLKLGCFVRTLTTYEEVDDYLRRWKTIVEINRGKYGTEPVRVV